jgi:hypothetical protein
MSELASQPKTIQSIYGMHAEDRLIVNRRYQRKLVWTLKEKQLLINSIANKYPIPAILVAERSEDNKFEIIDGLQRLHAIISFIENRYADKNEKYFNVNEFTTAKIRSEQGLFEKENSPNLITPKEVGEILDYTLAFSIMKDATKEEIDEVFRRINTYGHRLSDQERRQAGVENEFSKTVRQVASHIRGDTSQDTLPLRAMPSISIDLPKARHGYEIKADSVFWVKQGILRSTDLRDSMDEQCIADITACIVTGNLIERSKETLDKIYNQEKIDSIDTNKLLEQYGAARFFHEFNTCIEQIEITCNKNKEEKLRDIIFKTPTTNSFQAAFSAVMIAFHELNFKENKTPSDYLAIKNGLRNTAGRIETGKRATSPGERRANIDMIKGLIANGFSINTNNQPNYGGHTVFDIENLIRRSGIELSDYELKQGVMDVGDTKKINDKIIQKISRTICAIANNGPNRDGKIIIGVADNDDDAKKIGETDKISPKIVGSRYVVGVKREADRIGIPIESYVRKIKDEIGKSPLSQHLKTSILSHIDYHEFYDLGIIVITVPRQSKLSYYGEQLYWRKADSTVEASKPKEVEELARRFWNGAQVSS